MSEIADMMAELGARAKAAAAELRLAPAETKTAALNAMAAEIRIAASDIQAANLKDMAAAKKKGLTDAMLDRLALNPDRIEGIAKGLEDIAALPEPVGQIDKEWSRPNGLKFAKVRVPIGVIGMIYESRPNVTADAGGLCLKSGNACILRGGSESANSSRAIHEALINGLESAGLTSDAILMVPTTDREAVGELLGGLKGCVDLIIPRGGKGLIARVQRDARVPVLAHLEGLCHSYIHADADENMALEIVENAKLRRTGVCGSTETVLIDKAIATSLLPDLIARLGEQGCQFKGNEAAREIYPDMDEATDDNFATEYLAPILNIAVVEDIDAALDHIDRFSSGHTDAIITDNDEAALRFLNDVDSAIVIHNASTQYADGGEFGFGAEIGIATGRLHARGPVGAEHLTTYKYQVRGTGQTRPK
jgi:glutamate-5-semialdehyde dehydrogenase